MSSGRPATAAADSPSFRDIGHTPRISGCSRPCGRSGGQASNRQGSRDTTTQRRPMTATATMRPVRNPEARRHRTRPGALVPSQRADGPWPRWRAVGLLLFWEIGSRVGFVDPFFFSRPTSIAAAGIREVQVPRFWNDLRVSAFEFATGYVGAIVLGRPDRADLRLVPAGVVHGRPVAEPAQFAAPGRAPAADRPVDRDRHRVEDHGRLPRVPSSPSSSPRSRVSGRSIAGSSTSR